MKRWIVTADTIGNQIVELALFPTQLSMNVVSIGLMLFLRS